MNYPYEIRCFYEWLESNPLTPSSITLWYALMFSAYRRGRYDELNISVSSLITLTNLSRTSIYKERETLRTYGRIDFRIVGGRHWGVYRIISFESAPMSATRTQVCTQNTKTEAPPSAFVFATGTQQTTRQSTQHGFVSATRTQEKGNSTEVEKYSKKVRSKKGVIYSNTEEINKENNIDPRFQKFKEWLAENTPTVELMREPFSKPQYDKLFTDYHRDDILAVLLAMENYLPLVKRNKSAYLTTRNWLDRRAKPSEGANLARGQPATGQHIGQIKQPETEEKKQKLLERFESKK